jgi:GPI mannosyltransferase 3
MGPPTSTSDSTPISSSSANRILLAFFVLAFVLRLWVALTIPRTAHPDEIYQAEEPAHRLVFGYGLESWEWREGVRSWVLPIFLAEVMRATSWMGPGSSGYLLGIKLVLSLLSLTTIGFAFAFAKRASGNEAAIMAAGMCALWFSMVDFAPRAFTEVISAHILLPGLYLGMFAEKLNERARMFAVGLLCGLAACLRIQYSPAILFALVYFCRPAWKRRIPPMLLGVLVPVALFGAVDAVTWSYPFSSFLRYFSVNVIEGRSTHYGVMPWYWYLTSGLPQMLGPFVIVAPFGLRRSPFLSWFALIVLSTHSVLAHKEARFLYVLWPIVLTLAAIGTVDVVAYWNLRRKSPLLLRTVISAVLSFSAIVLVLVVTGYHFVGRKQGDMFLFDKLSRDSTVCGVGEFGLPWYDPGGYTHLHRDVPIVFLASESELNQTAASFNALVSKGTLASPPPGFTLQSCLYRSCLYRRPGTCASPGDNEMNAMLKRTNQ